MNHDYSIKFRIDLEIAAWLSIKLKTWFSCEAFLEGAQVFWKFRIRTYLYILTVRAGDLKKKVSKSKTSQTCQSCRRSSFEMIRKPFFAGYRCTVCSSIPKGLS